MEDKNCAGSIALCMFSSDHFGGAERRLLRAYGVIARSCPVDLVIIERREGDLFKAAEKASVDLSSFQAIHFFSEHSQGKMLIHLFRQKYGTCVFCYLGRFNAIATHVLEAFGRSATVLHVTNCRYALEASSPLDIKINPLFISQLKRTSCIDVLYPDQEKRYASLVGDERVCCTPGTFTDLDLFRPSRKAKRIVLLAARLDEVKNPYGFVESIELAAATLRECGYEALLCGQGENYQPLASMIADRGLDDCLKMPGYVKPEEVLSEASVACFLSCKENYPSQALAEATACGCCIIATNVGNTSSLVESSFGNLVEPCPAAIASALCSYMTLSAEDKSAIVQQARAFAEAHYHYGATVEHFRAINDKTRRRHDTRGTKRD